MASDLDGVKIDGEVGEILEKYFISDFRPEGYLRYRGVTLPACHTRNAQRMEDFEVRDDDVFVLSYPKTGTTWSQEMVWCIANDFDFEGGQQFLQERFPFLEHSSLFDYTRILPSKPGLVLPPFVADSLSYVSNIESRRFIKTHLPWPLLPKQIRTGERTPKLVYVCRNAKDTCISYYHHCILLEGYKGTFEDFCKLFLEDSLCFSPFWKHITDVWERREQSNILFLTYEDMKKDLPSVIRRTAKFLEKDLTEEQVKQLTHHLSFESMKNNKSVNYETVVEINRNFNLIPAEGEFMRQGTGGEWKGKMSPETIQQFDKWIADNTDEKGINIWQK